MIIIRYAQIRRMDISNGEGIGVSLFTQGCPFHCKNCFNKETWDYDKGKEWTKQTEDMFLKLINNPHIVRVSFLGGEPLYCKNLDKIVDLCTKIKNTYPDKKIWLYSGYKFEDIISDISRKNILQ
ncbi:MAG: anaerobic ribonucleoside-triphosphate reductase activating protein, partial [Bacillota bacterium]|nr:anaerobic ribonucleoside-triphosphate reductase activating protein [Bacillota bacterium]